MMSWFFYIGWFATLALGANGLRLLWLA